MRIKTNKQTNRCFGIKNMASWNNTQGLAFELSQKIFLFVCFLAKSGICPGSGGNDGYMPFLHCSKHGPVSGPILSPASTLNYAMIS